MLESTDLVPEYFGFAFRPRGTISIRHVTTVYIIYNDVMYTVLTSHGIYNTVYCLVVFNAGRSGISPESAARGARLARPVRNIGQSPGVAVETGLYGVD